jgi:hypothetical protein
MSEEEIKGTEEVVVEETEVATDPAEENVCDGCS